MSRIIAELFSTLDGVVATPQDWHGPYWSADGGERTERLLAESDVMLLGRNTYLEHAAYWPTDSGSMADLMNNVPKVVVSSTLETADWQNTTIARDGLAAAVADLAERNVVVTGSVALVKGLIGLGALTDLRLIVDPIALGSGVRLFDAVPATLELVESVPSATGAISLHYRLAR